MSIKKIILVFFVFLSILANAQEEFDAYNHKAPTIDIYGFVPWCYHTPLVYIGGINNGGYALKRAGVIFCNNCPDDPLTIPNNPKYLYEWTTNLTYVRTSEFVKEASGVSFSEGDVFRQRWFIETSSGKYFYGAIDENTVVCEAPNIGKSPTVESCDATISKTYNSAYLCGAVTSAGSSSVTSFGIAYSASPNIDITDNVVYGTGNPFTQWSVQITGLNANTTYYYRAFATNSYNTGYGAEYSFITACNQSTPTLSTTTTTNITTSSAISGGTITNNGGVSVIERGVCWNKTGSPTYSDSKTTDGTGIGSFTSSLTNLSPNTTYYVRAYAMNRCDNGGFYVYATGYGEEEIFTTASSYTCDLPSITTNPISSITLSSAIGGGNVSNNGGCNVVERGVCWSTSPNPTILNNKTTDGSGTGSFTSNLTWLACGTTYYVRAYATNSSGTAYGSQVIFTTGTCTYIPTVTINPINKYGDTYATFLGSVTSDGNSTVTDRGFVYATSTNPTVLNNKVTAGYGVGVFTANAYGLSPSTTYYVRAYATNSIGTAYSNELYFTTFDTQSVVSISTSVPIDITTSTATLGGNVSSDGGHAITERGVVYGTSVNPTTSNTKIQSGSGVGIYSVNVTGLVQGTTYYTRAYAINSSGTFYGENESFITSVEGATACNAGQSFPGGQSYPSTNTVVVGSGTGNVSLSFNASNIPDFFLVEYNSTLYNSGWRGSPIYDYGGTSRASFKLALFGKTDPSQNPAFPTTFPNIMLYPEDGYPRVISGSGSISFTKSTNNPTTAIVKVYAPMSGTSWNYTLSCPN